MLQKARRHRIYPSLLPSPIPSSLLGLAPERSDNTYAHSDRYRSRSVRKAARSLGVQCRNKRNECERAQCADCTRNVAAPLCAELKRNSHGLAGEQPGKPATEGKQAAATAAACAHRALHGAVPVRHCSGWR